MIVSALSISSANAANGTHPLLVVLDASLASSSENFAVHAASADKTIFLTGTDIANYIQSTKAEVKFIDFSKLASAPA